MSIHLSSSDPSTLSIDIVNATSNNTYVLDNVARDVVDSNSSFLIHWPSAIPSATNQYQLIFLSYTSGGFVSRSDTFTLTIPPGETRPKNSTQGPSGPSATDTASISNNNGGLSTGAKAAIGVIIPLFVLALLFGLYIFYRRKRKSRSSDTTTPDPEKPELHGSSKSGGFTILHKLRSELSGSSEKDGVKHKPSYELPAKNVPPVELPASLPPVIELDASDLKISRGDNETARRPLSSNEETIQEQESSGLGRASWDTSSEREDVETGGKALSSSAEGQDTFLSSEPSVRTSTAAGSQRELQSVGSGFVVARKPVAASTKVAPSIKSERTTASGSGTNRESKFHDALGELVARELDGRDT